MARRVKVFLIVLFSACLFSFNVNAEFGITDSSNLSQVKASVDYIEQYAQHLDYLLYPYDGTTPTPGALYSFLSNLPSISSKLDIVSSKLDSISSRFDPVYSKLDLISSQLQSIIELLSANEKDFNTDNALYCFDSFHYDGVTSDDYPGMIQSSGNLVIFSNTDSRYLNTWLPPGRYYLNVNIANMGSVTSSPSFVLESNTDYPSLVLSLSENFTSNTVFGNARRYTAFFDITNSDGLFFGDAWISTDVQLIYGCAYIYLIEGYESVVSSSMTPSIDSSNSNLSDGVNQLEGLEDQVFGSLDTSLGSIDFSGSALGQVVSGFNFIRAVFSAIYSSSPYISVLINLSCMFGVLALFLRVQPRFSRWEREHRDRSD